MPAGNHNREESSDFRLLEVLNNKKYEYGVATAERLAATEAAIKKHSISKILEADIAAEERRHAEKLRGIQEAYEDDVAKIKASGKTEAEQLAEIEKRRTAYRRARTREENASKKTLSRLQDELSEQEKKDKAEAHRIALSYSQKEYATASIYRKKELDTALVNLTKEHAEEQRLKYESATDTVKLLEQEKQDRLNAGKDITAIDKELTRAKEEQAEAQLQMNSAQADHNAALAQEKQTIETIKKARLEAVRYTGNGAESLLSEYTEELDKAKKRLEEVKVELRTNIEAGVKPEFLTGLREEFDSLTEKIGDINGGLVRDVAQLNEEAHKQRLAAINSQNKGNLKQAKLQEKEENYDQAKVDKEVEHDAAWEFFKSERGQQEARDKALTNALSNSISKALDQISGNITSFYQYQAHVEARLQGSDKSYRKALREVSNNIGISGVVSQKDVIAKIKEASDAGVAYNIELRAFLGTVADSIANTFDAFDASLLRIIRLQQADTTAARLGMEASLTKLFNKYFSDTSYLSDAFDSISQTLLDASSQLARDQSVAFEYMVQKWLGSLYSLGFSQDTLQTIAQGITYLGTGNVQELTANDSLNNLMAMAATRVGIDYGTVLVDGLDSDTTNKLLKSIVEYLQSIANNTDNNQVVKAAYTDVFGLNMTDLRAIQSLSQKDVDNIYNMSMQYNDMIKETNKQMLLTLTRVPFAQMIDTAFENAMAGASTAIGNNPALYATWKVLNVVEELTGGIDLPFLNVYGFGVDLNTTVTQLAKLGVGGLGLMGSLLGSLFSGGLFGTFNIDQWDWDEYTSRGSAAKGITKGSVSDVSESQEMSMNGSASSDDVKQSSMSDSADSAEEDSKVINKNVDQSGDIYEKIYAALADDETSVLKEAIRTNELLEENRVFKTSMDGMDALLDPYHIFYTQTIVYGADGKPVFGAAGGAPLGGGTGGSTGGTGTGGASGGGSTGDTGTSITDLITTTNDLLTAANLLHTAEKDNTSSIKSSVEPLSTKIDSIITSEGNVVTQLTAIKDLLSADRLFKTDAGGGATTDLSTINSSVTSIQDSANTITTLLTTTNGLLTASTTPAIDTSAITAGVESLSTKVDSIVASENNVVTQLTSIKDLLVADRVFKTDISNSSTNLDTINTALATIQSNGATITNLITSTNDLLKLDRVFNVSTDVDLTVIAQAIDTAARSIVSSLGVPEDSGNEETKPVLQSLFELLTASSVEGNVAAILEKLSSDRSYTVTATIPPLTSEQLTTLVGSTITFTVDTSLTDQNVVNSTLQDVQNSIEENNNSTQSVVDAADALTNSVLTNTQQSSSSVVENTTTQPPVTSTNTDVQQTDVSNSMVDNITSLVKSVEEWELLIAQAEAAQVVANETSKVVLPESMTASLTTISPDVKKQIEAVLKEAFVSALLGSSSATSEEETSLTSILQSVLSSLSVRVTNDFFDETLQKIAFTN